MPHPILTPALALVCWTLVMWVWLYATRLPAMRAAGLDPNKVKEKKDLDVLPRKVRQVADNYNHLHEQPVIFYALVFYCHLAGVADGTNVMLAWTYVGFRVAHSLFQALVNFIPVRFALFALGSFALMGIAVRSAIAALG
jgi:hypothetical protein